MSDVSLLTIEEAAARLHLSVSTLHKMCAAKLISYYKIGRRCFIRPDDAEAYLQSRRVEAVKA